MREEVPRAKVLILTVSDKETDLAAAAEAGASGYMLKNEAPDSLVQAIEHVAAGSTLVSPIMVARLAEGSGAPETALSPRELDILRLLAEEASDEEIASELAATREWVETTLSSILHKLRLPDRREAVLYAKRRGTASADDLSG